MYRVDSARGFRSLTEKRLLRIALALLLTSSAGCSLLPSAPHGVRDELLNQGPVSLSDENPYVVGNVFLAREMEDSDVLRGFIEYRGTPDIIEVKKDYFKPLRVFLFYVDSSEAYLLHERDREWFIRGPEAIPVTLLGPLSQMKKGGRSAPLPEPRIVRQSLEEPSAPTLATDGDSSTGEEVATGLEQKLVTDTPEAKTISGATIANADAADAASTESKSKRREGNQAKQSGFEESPSGDIIHEVAQAGETLSGITLRYTGDAANASRIARINGLKDLDHLRLGQNIRIPRYLLKGASKE